MTRWATARATAFRVAKQRLIAIQRDIVRIYTAFPELRPKPGQNETTAHSGRAHKSITRGTM